MKIIPTLGKVIITLVAIYVGTLVLSRATAPPEPTLFSDVNIADARNAVAGTSRLLVIDVGAAWCPPCREMKKTTWIDPQVESFFETSALAVYIDADSPPANVDNLHVRGYPTVIVYADRGKGVEEVSRKLGYLGPDELLEWLKGLQKGA